MSQAMRKLAPVVSKSNCLALFINQLRMKVGVMYGNPEVTSGGNALKYYASVRLDVRRTETLKNGQDAIGSHTRVKVVKNKLAPPFKQAEFDVLYGIGISKDSELVDLAVKLDIVEKSGSWFAYKGERLAQGRENVRDLLRNNPELSAEIEAQVRENMHKLVPGSRAAVSVAPAPVEIPLAAAPQVTSAAAKAQIDIVVDD
jgi:recombination protein RecA